MTTSSISRLRFAGLLCLVGFAALLLTGCRYATNRAADFADIFQFGIGITTESKSMGPVPPAIGLHVQATEFLNLGAIHYSGLSADWDGRGFFAGPEGRTRLGLGPWQAVRTWQDTGTGAENYFKRPDTLWAARMESPAMRWNNIPAKQLRAPIYDETLRTGTPVMHRGWQYWEHFSIEAAISEPFLTHLGLKIRVGFDPSEVADFILGFVGLDFKRDDLTRDEMAELRGPRSQRAEDAAFSDTEEWTTEPTETWEPEDADILPDELPEIPTN